MSYSVPNTLGGEKNVTGVIPGTYGSNTSVSQITVDRYGRITSAANVAITGGGSSQWINDATGIHYSNTVGIGTSTPGAMLDVVTNAIPEVGALIAQFGTTVTPRIQFYDEAVGLPPYIYGAAGNGLGLASSGPITFYPNENPIGNPVLTVNSSGAQLTGSLYANLVHLSNTNSVYTYSVRNTFADSPYTTALNASDTTLVLGYTTRVDIFDLASNTVVFTDTVGAWSVSINDDATVVVVGEPTTGATGTVYTYIYTGGVWTRDDPSILTGTMYFGYSVSLNSAGDKLLVNQTSSGSAITNSLPDSVYLYKYVGGWVLDTTFSFDNSVSSVALSGDGNTCVFGLPGYHGGGGAVYITQDRGVTYTVSEGDNAGDFFGYYVSCNYDGTKVVANTSNGGTSNYIKILTYS
jgi:hypothetical protein